MALIITKAKPNPLGKDRFNRYTPATQLAAEWIDISNTGPRPVKLDGCVIYHLAYINIFKKEWKSVTPLSGVLPVGQTVRIHSGLPIPLAQMNLEDRVGAQYHIFTKQNYIWNNLLKDIPSIWYTPTKQWIDQAEYIPYNIEGKVLRRVMKRLM